MNVLSFTSWEGVHDTSAALVCDGEIVAAAQQERFSRIKNDSAEPFDAIQFCLDAGGLDMGSIDLIAYPDRPFRTGAQSQLAEMDIPTIRRLQADGHVRRRSVIHKRALDLALRLGAVREWSYGMAPKVAQTLSAVRERFGALPATRFYGHHLCHAATSYLTSGFHEAAIATADGRGNPFAAATWRARGHEISRLRGEPWSNSLGVFYSDYTEFLDLGASGEGKTMGLAGYGTPARFEAAVGRTLDVESDSRWYRYVSPPSQRVLGTAPRTGESATEDPFPDIAAAVQDHLERAVGRIASSARTEAGSAALCLGGGVALNCAANGRLRAAIDGPVWAYAPAGDAGLPIGAALLAAAERGELERKRVEHAYWGPEFGEHEVEQVLREEPDVTYTRSSDPIADAAALLAAGKIIGWCQGRMEMGPRALGNRSILADPRHVATRDRVNDLKGREPWRPLSPSVLTERAAELFDLEGDSPFMLFAAQTRQAARDRLGAVVHVDGTARPQSVSTSTNPRFHALISAFERRTGVPAVLNTSFNAAGEPIVCSPRDAVRTFLSTGLDALVFGDFIVRRQESADG